MFVTSQLTKFLYFRQNYLCGQGQTFKLITRVFFVKVWTFCTQKFAILFGQFKQ
jgi:hypothetical protein